MLSDLLEFLPLDDQFADLECWLVHSEVKLFKKKAIQETGCATSKYFFIASLPPSNSLNLY